MALSGSILCNIHRYLDLEFVWIAAQDPAAGGSMIYWHTLLRAGEYGRIEALPGSEWSVVIDGQVFSGGTNISIPANSAKELASGSVFLKHDAFGEKSFDFSFSQMINITYDGVYTGVVSGSGTAVLDRLDPDVAPAVDKPEVFLGDSLRITPKGPLGATYRLRYAMGASEGVIGENITGPVDWVVPVELGQQMPYTEKGVLRILCDAYRDGVPFGRSREAAVLVWVPDSAVPVVENFVLEDTSAAKALGFFVQNVSRLEGSAQCVGAMGSRVVRCEMTLGGKPLGLVRQAGEVELLVTATDSRGRVGQLRQTVSVVAYQAPQVRVSAHRCLADGSADDTGGWAKIRLEADWTVLGAVEPMLELNMDGQSLDAVSLQSQEEGKLPGDRMGWVALEWTVPAAEDQAHAITGVFRDGLLEQEFGMALSTAYCIMDVLYGGRGVAFGTVAREPGFVCAMDAKFTGKVILPDGSDLMERLAQVGG